MAINKVIYGGTTLIDISDTTADASDVMEGKYFYNASNTSYILHNKKILNKYILKEQYSIENISKLVLEE